MAMFRADGVEKQNGDTIYVCKGKTVFYKDSSSGATTRLWSFKNGFPTTSNSAALSVLYNNVGIDSTILEAQNGPIANRIFVFVKVSDEQPVANFSYSPGNLVCGSDLFTFTNTSTGNNIISYLWNFGDGTTSTLTNPTHQFYNAIGSPGTSPVTVSLTVTNIYGCSTTFQQTFNVKNVPDPGLTCTNAEISNFEGLTVFRKCGDLAGFTFNFTNNSSTTNSNTEYTIVWGDGSPDLTFTNWPALPATISHNYPQGIDTLTLKVKNADGCTNERKYLVFVGLRPLGGAPSPAENACAPLTKTFNIIGASTNPPGTLYYFYINDTFPKREIRFTHPPPASFTHTFTTTSCGTTSATGQANSFSVEWAIINPCDPPSTGATASIFVSSKPKSKMLISPDTIVCTGTPVSITNCSDAGSEITFSGANAICTRTLKKVWEISPTTGYTITSGILGNTNGSTDVTLWNPLGSDVLQLNFTVPGIYQVKLYAGNKCGVDTLIRTICVRLPPTASFTMNNKTACKNGSAKFTNTSPVGTCGGETYLWQVNFEDPLNCSNNNTPAFEFTNGTANNSTSPEIAFNKPGRFIIRLTVNSKGSGCTAATSQPDTFIVKGPPKVSLTPLTTICPGDSIIPQASVTACYSNGPLTCNWIFTGGSITSSANCLPGPVIYNAIGNYPVSITVTDPGCNLDTTVTDTVRVINAPTANAGPDTTFCSGDTIQIGPAPQPGVTYQWTPAAGLSNPNIANPFISLVYNGPNNYIDSLYVLNVSGGPGCKGTDTINIRVKKSPLVTINPSAIGICKDSAITLTASGADTYVWTHNGATTSSVVVQPAITTTYEVTGALNAGGCTGKSTATVTVSDKAKADFQLTDSVYCVPLNLDTAILVTHYPGRNLNYNWYLNGTLIGSNQTGTPPVYIINTPGTLFTIKLVTTSAAGCATDSMELRFRTRVSAIAGFSIQATDSCGPLTVSFADSTAPPGNDALYFWSFGNGNTSNLASPGPQIYPASSSFTDTTYYITLKVFDGCDTTRHTDSIKVYSKPRARFGVNATTGCSNFHLVVNNTSLGFASAYYWDFGNGHLDTTNSLAEITGTIYNTAVIDTFRVMLIAENFCGRDTQYLDIVISPITIQPQILVSGPSQFGCVPPQHVASFNNSSVGAAFLVWNYGDGSPRDTTPNFQGTITHNYTQPGTYTVSVRLFNNCSDTTIFMQVVVYPRPQASFTLNRNLICPGEPVSVTSTSTNANGVEWLWGDGSSSTGNTAVHIYNTPGIFNIRVVAKRLNNFGLVCTDTSAPQTVTVQPNIPAIIRMDTVRPLCATYTFSGEAIGAAGASVVRWTFYDTAQPPGIFVVNGVTASHDFATPGTYQVKLFTQNSAGCTDSTIKTIKVYPIPAATFDTTPLSTCLADTIARFSATYSYAWPDPISLRWFVNGQPVGVGSVLNYQFRLPPGAA
ncbi:MAG: PKD domain-containing protein, partial [Dinghuibacter sp.]|nr:PKD domain-containing protein [Dinghuibacter sp.]